MRRSAGMFAHDERGIAAVEFALCLPALVALLFGGFELVQFFAAERRTSHSAAAIADVVAQGRSITSAQLTDVMNIGPTLVSPLPTNTLGEQVSSFTADASGKVAVDWTSSSNYSGPAPSVPAGYLAANESVIAVDVVYQFTSPLRVFLPGSFTFQRHAYARPRLSSQVVRLP